MNQEKQRVAIAEACGWTHEEAQRGFKTAKLNVDGKDYDRISDNLPDYLNDLNAMHNAEAQCEMHYDQKWIETIVMVSHDVFRRDADRTDGWDWVSMVSRLSAAQRAEAFLRTIGKWEEEEEA